MSANGSRNIVRAYTCLGDSPEVAVAETTLCRDLTVTGIPRLVPRARISLHGPHLAAYGQDT